MLQKLYRDNIDVPVILTAYSISQEEIVRARRLGVAGFVERDKEPRVFMTSLAKILDGKTCRTIEVLQTAEILFKRYGLSDRDIEVAHLIANGSSNQQIAEELALVVGTVKLYASRIYSKIGIRSRIDLLTMFKAI